MEFTKYLKHGAYHWKQYESLTKYKKHADKCKKWVKEKKILDVGAGDGLITHLMGADGIDSEPEAVRLAKEKGANVKLGSAYKLEGEYNAVTMFDVIEHLERPQEALQEALRVAPVLYISTPPKRDDGVIKDKFHYFELTPQGLVELVESAGYILDGNVEVNLKDKLMYGRFKRNLSDSK